MSNTTTIPRVRTAISRRTSSILLSPSKRRRTDAEQPSRSKEDAIQSNERSEEAKAPQPTPAEILRWTFTKAAVASCFVRDVFEMRECGMRDMEYFWLGRIPCRTVRLVGLVVGVQVWEKRTVYTLDDGTAVVDCAHAHVQARPPSPVKLAPQTKSAPFAKGMTKASKSTFADYLPSARRVPVSSSTVSSSTISIRRNISEPPPSPKPVVRVGRPARVVGRVVVRHDTRIVLVDEIVLCASYNDESNHCISVSDLHRTTYHPSEPLPPFVPPPLSVPSAAQFPASAPSRPTSPFKHKATQEPQTPASVRSAASSTTTSPSTTVASSSPASSTTSEYQIPRLRHPSRLHTRDLTANTFRIYVKHYMDNAPPPPRPRRRARSRSSSPSPTPRHTQRQRDTLGTPTKSLPANHSDATPRPSRTIASKDRTPRRSLNSGDISNDDPDDESDDGSDDQMYGYTLSHLRRIPELSFLARRVLKADAHRRAKEERQKAKAHGSRSQQPSTSSTSAASARTSHATTDAPLNPGVKRLFKQVIRTLFSEGDIVLWNGPVHPLPAPALDPFLPSSSALWKVKSSTNSVVTSVSSSGSVPRYEEWEDETLSEPVSGEEAYVPLTPAYFSRVLERAICTIMAESACANSRDATPTAKKTAARSTSLVERLRAQESASGGFPPGPTKEELLAWLRSSDERWARVGEWSVEEALAWGNREGRLWCVGKGRWEVCG